MALYRVDLTGAIEAGQEIIKHATSKDVASYQQTVAIAAANVANYVAQVVLHDAPAPGPVLSMAPVDKNFFQGVLSAAESIHAAEPVGSVLSETLKTFIEQMKKWFKAMGWIS